ncbi:hypothetical protein MARCHEWKA_03880 [Brevundimonas phage vB_BpoS-Marchewka]|uniref:Uncharacterized protein n=1 Tax=Brevundimonas phage vB_BpoS-Marchewka TaxID=2948604 RepID=A0A9E7N4R5_9CAUD|nr:hypothetical protein MARCHEWKA_03880 [Brevundimonas phage vB_BpoS-Marchewka]
MKRHVNFINERGRKIRLEVRKHLLEGSDVKGVTYVLTGPHSTTEQTMTRVEAHLLASLLAEQMGYSLVPSPRTGRSNLRPRRMLTRRAS